MADDSKVLMLDELLSKSDKVLDSIPAQIVTLECYDDSFGIYETSSQGQSPLSLIAMHEPEDLAMVDPYDLYLERYLAANVLKFTGMPFDSFMKLTNDRAEAILKRCDTMASKEDNEVGNLMSSMGKPNMTMKPGA